MAVNVIPGLTGDLIQYYLHNREVEFYFKWVWILTTCNLLIISYFPPGEVQTL